MTREPLAASAREAGFTLIELLVSLTILGVMLGLLGGGIRVLSKNSDARAERIDTLDMVSRASDIFARDTAGLQRLVVNSGIEGAHFIFTGGVDRMSFITVEPPFPSSSGPYFVNYSVSPNGDDSELIRARAPYQDGMRKFPGATPANRVKLLQGPFRYQFSYGQRTARGTEWRANWATTTRLPDLIRLQVLDTRRNAAVSPAMIVAVAADAEMNCLAEQPLVCSAQTAGDLKAADTAKKKEGSK